MLVSHKEVLQVSFFLMKLALLSVDLDKLEAFIWSNYIVEHKHYERADLCQGPTNTFEKILDRKLVAD